MKTVLMKPKDEEKSHRVALSAEDHSRMNRLREEILGRYCEMSLIIGRTLGKKFKNTPPTIKEVGQRPAMRFGEGEFDLCWIEIFVSDDGSVGVCDEESATCEEM